MKFLRLIIIMSTLLLLCSCKESTSTNSEVETITFNDASFEQLIREALEIPTGDITDSDMAALTELLGTALNIVDITGIEYCINLVYLDLSDNQITDISKLVENTGFDTDDFIDLQGNPLNDQAKNTDVHQLRNRGVYVFIDETEMVVTIPNTNFETLLRDILQKQTGDLTNSDLATITRIDIRDGDITDLTGIKYCKNITYINLYRSNITDIAEITGLRKLKEIYFARNSIESISSISGMYQLWAVGIGYNNIADLSPLMYLPKLTYLSIGANPISDLSIIGNLTLLTYLSIVELQLTDLGIIESLVNLASIEARYNTITDISALSNTPNLERIAINGNNISDIGVLTSLTNLNNIDFGSNSITDISVITNLPQLQYCAFYDNQITDISSFASITCDIFRVYLQNNQISDLKPLVDCATIGDGDQVWLQNNPLSTTSINTYIPQLEARGVTVYQ